MMITATIIFAAAAMSAEVNEDISMSCGLAISAAIEHFRSDLENRKKSVNLQEEYRHIRCIKATEQDSSFYVEIKKMDALQRDGEIIYAVSNDYLHSRRIRDISCESTAHNSCE